MRKILIRATNWVGDAVMSLPAIRAVAARYPDAELAVLARPWVADLYARESAVARVIPYTPRSGRHDLAGKWKAARSLRAERFDCAILLQNAFEAAAVARTAGIPRIIGYARDGRGFLLSDAIPVPKPGEIPPHERFYYLELLRRAGLLDAMPPDEPIRLETRQEPPKPGAPSSRNMGSTNPRSASAQARLMVTPNAGFRNDSPKPLPSSAAWSPSSARLPNGNCAAGSPNFRPPRTKFRGRDDTAPVHRSHRRLPAFPHQRFGRHAYRLRCRRAHRHHLWID